MPRPDQLTAPAHRNPAVAAALAPVHRPNQAVNGAAKAVVPPVNAHPASKAPVSAALPAILASFLLLIGFFCLMVSACIYPNSPSSSIIYALPVIGSKTPKLLLAILVFFLILLINSAYTLPQISLSIPSNTRTFPTLLSKSFPNDLHLIGFLRLSEVIVKTFFLRLIVAFFPLLLVTLVSKSKLVVVFALRSFLIGLVKTDVGKFVLVIRPFSVDCLYWSCTWFIALLKCSISASIHLLKLLLVLPSKVLVFSNNL